MTPTESMIEYLTSLTELAIENGTDGIDFPAHATTVLAAGKPAAYVSIKDVADLTGRTKGTILSWIQRGQHGTPQPLGSTAAGMVWDRQEWVNWVGLHPKLVHRS
jgi:predicted DNA-binding transcriptional regulator AlpA